MHTLVNWESLSIERILGGGGGWGEVNTLIWRGAMFKGKSLSGFSFFTVQSLYINSIKVHHEFSAYFLGGSHACSSYLLLHKSTIQTVTT